MAGSRTKKIHKALLARADIAALIEFVVGPHEAGENVRCPLAAERHSDGDDSNPSMSIRPEDGAAYCHTCGTRASSIVGLYQEIEGASYFEALKSLWSAGVEPVVPESEVTKANTELLGNELMLQRLESLRGITADTVAKFELGWRGDRLWIPVRNDVDLIVDVRKYDLMSRRRGPKAAKVMSYKKGYGHARIYPLASMRRDRLVMLEGEMDTLLALQLGLPAVCITSGAMTMTASLAKAFSGKSVALIPDNDKAGMDGARKKKVMLEDAGADAYIVTLPVESKGQDFTDFILKCGGDISLIEDSMPREARRRTRKRRANDEGEIPLPEKVTLGLDERGDLDIPMDSREQTMVKRSLMVLDYMRDRGGFFKNDMGQVFYATGRDILPIEGGKSHFASYLSRLSPVINQATPTGRFVLNHVQSVAYSEARLSKMGAWALYEDPGKIYLSIEGDKVARVDGSGRVVTMDNALNADSVLLELPVTSAAVRLRSTTPRDAVKLLWNKVAKHVPCHERDRYMVVCWLIGVLFREFIRPKPLLRFVASTAGGKTTASKLLAYLIYGDEILSHSASTLASSYGMARTHPLMVFDNIETRNMTQPFEDFLLVASTGGTKTKRAQNTDMGIVSEKINSLVITNGIEPFSKNELINRTIEIELDIDAHGHKPFHEYQVLKSLQRHRHDIWSGLLKLAARDVFPRIADGEVARIGKEFSAHSMERFNDYWALMCVILDAVWAYRPGKCAATPRKLVNQWLKSQDRSAEERKESTNDVLYYLSTLIERHSYIDSSIDIKDLPDGTKKFRCSTRTLLTDFRLLAKNLGERCPWNNERQLGSRIADAEAVLAHSGWRRRVRTVNGHKQFEYKYKEARDASADRD